MNDVERELRTMFARRQADPAESPLAMPPRLARRTRMRQVLTVATSLAVVTVIVLASLAAIRVVSERDNDARPADVQVVLPDAPSGFLSAALPYASIAYPERWYLLETSPLIPDASEADVPATGPILQLSNFDPDLPRAPKCMLDPDALPPDGVLLTVGIMTEEEAAISTPSSGPWPVELAPLPSNMDPVCQGAPRIAAWTVPSGLIYWATAGHGPDASDADVQAMDRAFASLQFPPTDRPQMSQMAAFQSQGTPRVVLGTETIGSSVAAIVAYVELNKSLLVGISSSDGSSDCCLGGAFAPHSGSTDEPVSSTIAISPGGTLVYGVISPEVARAELRTSEGDALPVSTATLPPSLGVDDRVVWAVAPGSDQGATIVGYDAEGTALGNPVFPTGPRATIATGTDPQGGPWTLYLEVTSLGTGLEFGFDNSGAGSRCCLKPLQGDFRLDGWSSGGDGPNNITAVASEAVTRVVFEAAGGMQIEGQLFPVPDESLGVPKVALVIVPHDVPLEGDLVAYDTNGDELGREPISNDVGEPPGPTA